MGSANTSRPWRWLILLGLLFGAAGSKTDCNVDVDVDDRAINPVQKAVVD